MNFRDYFFKENYVGSAMGDDRHSHFIYLNPDSQDLNEIIKENNSEESYFYDEDSDWDNDVRSYTFRGIWDIAKSKLYVFNAQLLHYRAAKMLLMNKAISDDKHVVRLELNYTPAKSESKFQKATILYSNEDRVTPELLSKNPKFMKYMATHNITK